MIITNEEWVRSHGVRGGGDRPMTDRIQCDPADEGEILDELTYQVSRLGLDYADTFRATPVEAGLEAHHAKRSCCAAWDVRYTCRSGRIYYIGCNYDH